MLVTKKETQNYSKFVFFNNGQYEKRYKFFGKETFFNQTVEKMPYVQKYYENLDILFEYETGSTSIDIKMGAVKNTDFDGDFLQWLRLYKNSLKDLQSIVVNKYYIGMNDCKPENFCYYNNKIIWIDEDNFTLHKDADVAKLNCLDGIYRYLRCRNSVKYNESDKIPLLSKRIAKCVMEIFDD